MDTVAIVGVGLIGGSFGLALQKAGFKGRILGVSSAPTLEQALAAGAIHAPASLEEAAQQADLIYLAQPISRIIETITALEELARPACLVTDAGSTKAQIVLHAANTLTRCGFLGGHPMAGRESRGVTSADADLFRGKTYVLTPRDGRELNTPLASDFVAWIARIGGLPVTLTPEEHDRTVAFTSHLPQMASTALAAALAENLSSDTEYKVSGPGLIDTTRLALSSFEIWSDIVQTNTSDIDHALKVYIDKLEQLRQNLTTRKLREEFLLASQSASRIRRGRSKG
ncbi:MAG: prephenate dehydrogenase [Bryobacteraceae bacterium]